MLQTIQETLWNQPGKILCLSIWDIKNSKKSNSVCPRYQILSICFDFVVRCSLDFSCVFRVDVLKIFLRRGGIENDTFFIIEQQPNLDLNFISIKKHEMEITLNFVFSRNVP